MKIKKKKKCQHEKIITKLTCFLLVGLSPVGNIGLKTESYYIHYTVLSYLQFITNLATFYTFLQPKFLSGYFAFLLLEQTIDEGILV